MTGPRASLVQQVLELPCTQAQFAAAVGVSEAKVSQMVAEGVLEPGATFGRWLVLYTGRLREQAAGRSPKPGDGGIGDLTYERTLNVREERITREITNKKLRGEWSPIQALEMALAIGSQRIVQRMDQLDSRLMTECSDLPIDAIEALRRLLSEARNAWVRDTRSVLDAALDDDEPMPEPEPDESQPIPLPELDEQDAPAPEVGGLSDG